MFENTLIQTVCVTREKQNLHGNFCWHAVAQPTKLMDCALLPCCNYTKGINTVRVIWKNIYGFNEWCWYVRDLHWGNLHCKSCCVLLWNTQRLWAAMKSRSDPCTIFFNWSLTLFIVPNGNRSLFPPLKKKWTFVHKAESFQASFSRAEDALLPISPSFPVGGRKANGMSPNKGQW